MNYEMSDKSFFLHEGTNNATVIDMITTEVPGLINSPEYSLLDVDEQTMPGLVCAALARLLIRLEQDNINKALSRSDKKTLQDCYLFVEKLLLLRNPDVHNLIVTEIFENLTCEKSLWERIFNNLGEKSQQLLREYQEKGLL